MNTTILYSCIILVSLILCLIIFRNTVFIRKYSRYALILIPALLIIIIIILRGKAKTSRSGESELVKALDEVKDKLQEARMTAVIEVTATREKNQVKLEELKKVTQIEDSQERRKRLAELMD